MTLPPRSFDWSQVSARKVLLPVDSRSRLRLLLAVFLGLACVVLARVVALELSYGAQYRAEAARPLSRRQPVPGVRGRILTRDGTVLASDHSSLGLAIHFRYLEASPEPAWLRGQARARLTAAERRQPERVAAEQRRWLVERGDLHRRLAQLCSLPDSEFQSRLETIERRVRRIRDRVNQGREEPVVVREELDYHVVCGDLPLEVVAEIEARGSQYPGVRLVPQVRRHYPNGSLAAHVLGHLGPVDRGELDAVDPLDAYQPLDRVGRSGIERQFESRLRGRPGEVLESTDHSGRVLSQSRSREPAVGRDVVLTIDPGLQRMAESLLDAALERRRHFSQGEKEPGGGAIVAIDVQSGAVLTAASGPRFDPNLFELADSGELARLLSSAERPLFDRVAQMAIPPGSVFKALTAVALLEDGRLDPNEAFECQGYLNDPDRLRCQLYRRQGIGHGPTTLIGALTRSCNVYFFHFSTRLQPQVLPAWAERFGFGQQTGVDLPDEATGKVPRATALSRPADVPRPEDIAATRALAIGQSSLMATPLQVARLMAALANGGRLVTPHVVSGMGISEQIGEATADEELPPIAPPRPIQGLSAETIAVVRRGLERVVSDPEGTGHATVWLDSVTIAGKTGTAETGAGQSDHAWFAGYAPAESPRVAFAIAVEHAGAGSEVAGPMARRLVARMHQLGYFSRLRKDAAGK